MRTRSRKLKLFLSYSRSDAEIANDLRHQLIASGFDVWQDTQELLTGDSFQTRIRRALSQCDGYLVLVTPSSLASSWVLLELGGAWLTGIPTYPIYAAESLTDLPGPLRELNCSPIGAVTTELLPALHKLEEVLATNSRVLTMHETEELVRERTSHLSQSAMRNQVTTLLTEALSSDRATRRMAHVSAQQASEAVRSQLFMVLKGLTTHPDEHVRGEAYYCLGRIRDSAGRYSEGEEFFREGLSDDSVFVQACCANVLQNFSPLGDETISKLTEILAFNSIRPQRNEVATKLVYYASMTINRQQVAS